jgi:hypothetical protein
MTDAGSSEVEATLEPLHLKHWNNVWSSTNMQLFKGNCFAVAKTIWRLRENYV